MFCKCAWQRWCKAGQHSGRHFILLLSPCCFCVALCGACVGQCRRCKEGSLEGRANVMGREPPQGRGRGRAMWAKEAWPSPIVQPQESAGDAMSLLDAMTSEKYSWAWLAQADLGVYWCMRFLYVAGTAGIFASTYTAVYRFGSVTEQTMHSKQPRHLQEPQLQVIQGSCSAAMLQAVGQASKWPSFIARQAMNL